MVEGIKYCVALLPRKGSGMRLMVGVVILLKMRISVNENCPLCNSIKTGYTLVHSVVQ